MATTSPSIGTGAWIENDGTVGGAKSTIYVSNGGFITTTALKDIAATVNGAGSSIWLTGEQSSGLVDNNSTINLIGSSGSSPKLYFASISSTNLFTDAVLATLFVNDAPAFWGSNPEVLEPGDTLLATAMTFQYSASQPQLSNRPDYLTTRNGYQLSVVPEPSSALAGILLGFGLLRRRR